MEGDAIGVEAEAGGVRQHVDGHGGRAAELARQRPFGAFARGQDAAEDAGAGGGAGDLFDFLDAVDGEERDAELMGAGNVALLLDGVAVGDAVRRRAGVQRHLDLGDRSGVEGGAEAFEQAQDFRRRVGLDGIEDAAVRQRPGEGAVIVADDVEIDDEAGGSGTSGGEEFMDAGGRHGGIPSAFPGSLGCVKNLRFRTRQARRRRPMRNHVKISDRLAGLDCH